jgi:hypothetical protein
LEVNVSHPLPLPDSAAAPASSRPPGYPQTFEYIASDVPAGVTLRAWHRSHTTPRKRRLRALLGLGRSR